MHRQGERLGAERAFDTTPGRTSDPVVVILLTVALENYRAIAGESFGGPPGRQTIAGEAFGDRLRHFSAYLQGVLMIMIPIYVA